MARRVGRLWWIVRRVSGAYPNNKVISLPSEACRAVLRCWRWCADTGQALRPRWPCGKTKLRDRGAVSASRMVMDYLIDGYKLVLLPSSSGSAGSAAVKTVILLECYCYYSYHISLYLVDLLLLFICLHMLSFPLYIIYTLLFTSLKTMFLSVQSAARSAEESH